MRFPLLNSPITINGLKLKNRVVMPPMCTSFATIGGAVTDRLIGYYRERAKGGVGLINVEFSYIHPEGKIFEHMLGIYDDRLVPGLRRLTRALQDEGAKVIIQISHGGRRAHSDVIGCTPVAPSPIPRIQGETPRELSEEDIEGIIQAFVAAAIRSKEADFDGVMIHMAHGYLIQQFLSPYSNKRLDRYGGNRDGRYRFALQILKRIRKAVGTDYPITCRLCGNEFVAGGFDLEEAVRFAAVLESSGMDAIEISAGTHETPEMISAPPQFKMGFLSHLSKAVKQAVSIPVGIVGRIHDPVLAESLLREGKADLIAVGRGLIADPEWPRKAFEDRIDEICPCISCNTGCNDRMYYQQDVSCTVNPSVGREITLPVRPAETKKRVLILGGGPAGMEAAKIAAMRGHVVRICEKDAELGGQLKIASVPPAKEDLENLRKFLVREMDRLGVTVTHGVIDREDILKFSPDLLLVAVGGKPKALQAPGFDGKIAVSAWDVLARRTSVGKKVVIIGGGQVGLETADFLLGDDKEIIIVEMLKRVGQDMSPRARKMVLEKLVKNGVDIMTETAAMAIEGNDLVVSRAGVTDRVLGIDSVIVAVGTDPQEAGIPDLDGVGCPVRLIGDCRFPRKAFEAFHEGFMAGMEM